MNNKETGPPSLIRGSKSKHVGKLNLHGAVGQDCELRVFFSKIPPPRCYFHFFLSLGILSLSEASPCTQPHTRAHQIIRAVRRNGDLSPCDSQSVKKNTHTKKSRHISGESLRFPTPVFRTGRHPGWKVLLFSDIRHPTTHPLHSTPINPGQRTSSSPCKRSSCL